MSDIKALGNLTVELKDEFGNIKETREIKNLVVTVGREFIASRLVGTTQGIMSHMAVGTNSTAAAAANTTLGTEVGRVGLTGGTGTATGATVAYSATFPAGTGTGAIVEAGILNASSAGTLLCRTTFSVVNKAAADTLTINWNVTINAA